MVSMAQISGYYTVPEAAGVIGRTGTMISRYIRMGLLPARRVGKSYLIEQAAVHKFVPPPRGNPNFRKK
jgi:excisionase family DNA binding protein